MFGYFDLLSYKTSKVSYLITLVFRQVCPLFNLIIFKELRNILLKFSTFTLGTHKILAIATLLCALFPNISDSSEWNNMLQNVYPTIH